MNYPPTALDCGRDLEESIAHGDFAETDLTASGHANLKLWREHTPTLTELLLEDDDE